MQTKIIYYVNKQIFKNSAIHDYIKTKILNNEIILKVELIVNNGITIMFY